MIYESIHDGVRVKLHRPCPRSAWPRAGITTSPSVTEEVWSIEMDKWCKEYPSSNRYCFDWELNTWKFEDEKDAVLFALRWS